MYLKLGLAITTCTCRMWDDCRIGEVSQYLPGWMVGFCLDYVYSYCMSSCLIGYLSSCMSSCMSTIFFGHCVPFTPSRWCWAFCQQLVETISTFMYISLANTI